MAFDGFTVAAMTSELSRTLDGGVITKITQPEPDAILLTVKQNKDSYRLYISANASLPLIYLTDENKPAPMTAPAFCMLLRKHLAGGRILRISQPGMERVIDITVSHRDELGDLRETILTSEFMGKYSNIILREGTRILDSVKRIPAHISSVREVLPGERYFIPGEKEDPKTKDAAQIGALLSASSGPLSAALGKVFSGFSKEASFDLLDRADVPDIPWNDLDAAGQEALTEVFLARMSSVRAGDFRPVMLLNEDMPVSFSVFPPCSLSGREMRTYDSVSTLLRDYYAEKNKQNLIRQKTAGLRQTLESALQRAQKKRALQETQLLDTEKADQDKLYGELLYTYAYQVPPDTDNVTLDNYYTGEKVTIPLKPELSASQNAGRYYARYDKRKRTREAVTEQLAKTKEQILWIDSILTSLAYCETEADLAEVRREMADAGIGKHTQRKGKGKEKPAKPLVYRSSDGFLMYVGKNNIQNELVTFGIAGPDDYWFHANDIPGSHVIIKGDGREIPDRTFEEAGALAAHYSKAGSAPKVEIDYTLRRNLRRVHGAAPGFVIYHTNYSLIASTDISGIRPADEA